MASKMIMGPSIKLSADYMLHTVPLGEKVPQKRRRKGRSPFCEGDYADSPSIAGRQRNIYHRENVLNESSRRDAFVCLSCEAPVCRGEQTCFSRRKKDLIRRGELPDKHTDKGSKSMHIIRGTKDAG